MISISDIQRALEGLSPDEMKTFRAWYAEWDAEEWDRQIESDVAAGKLDALVAEAGDGVSRIGVAIENLTIEVRTFANFDKLRLAGFERLGGGSGYKCHVSVVSNGFTCERRFYFDDLATFVKALQKMHEGHAGEAELGLRYENECLRFTMNRQGHVIVGGELIDYGELRQFFRFAFRTDQTVLKPLIRDLQVLLGG